MIFSKKHLLFLSITFSYLITLSYERDLSILLEQLKNHPNQTLQDVYKSCYQDEYGPGHIISDEQSSLNYLVQETNTMEKDYNPVTLFERTGLDGDYVRVDLSLLQNNTVPLFVLFKSLLFSAQIGGQKTDDGWPDIWSNVVEEIKNAGLEFPNFEEDVERLSEISKSDDKVVHHSDIYEETYHPHYRIIEINVFKEFIEPFIK